MIHFEDFRLLDFLIREVFVHDTYFFRCDKPAPTVIDAGSNIGMFTLYTKHLYPDAEITAFEPDEHNFGLLRKNIASNNLAAVDAHCVLLAGEEKEVTFFHAKPGMGQLMNSVVHERAPAGKSSTVRSKTLSSFISKRVDYLKLDIEGSEHGVLQDLEQSGKLRNIDQMGIEYHHNMGPTAPQRLSSFLDLLDRNDFTYQVRAEYLPQDGYNKFQDLMIYAQRKNRTNG